jgi:hypothetical protein
MRGCLTLIVGIVVGVVAMALMWPHAPSGVTAPPSTADVRATISNAYLSRLVGSRLARRSIPRIREVRITSNPPADLVADAKVSLGPLSAPVTIEVQPQIEGGVVRAHIVSTHVGAVPVPSFFTGVLEESINDAMKRAIGTSTRVTGVQILPGGLAISADYR